jgi:chemotaxis protein MotB
VYWDAASGQRDRWMVSYMDVLTILLIFFVAIAAQSVKSAQLKTAPPTPLDFPRVPESRPPLARLQDQLEHLGLGPALQFRLDARGLVIDLPQTVLFAPGEDRINPAALPVVGQIAGILRGLPNRVSLIGHADSVPIHNRRFRNNWELSASRSLQLLELLTTRYGIPEPRLSVESYGALNPETPNDTKDGRAHNRRVEIVVRDDDPTRP